MHDVSLFLIGFFFGGCCAFAILATLKTSNELDDTNRIIEQLEIRDEIISRQRELIKNLLKNKGGKK